MKQIIKTDEEEAKYELIIPKGYEASLLNNGGESNIEIHVKKRWLSKTGRNIR